MSIPSNSSLNCDPKLPGDTAHQPCVLWIRQETFNGVAAHLIETHRQLHQHMCRQHIQVRWSSLDSLPHESLDGVDLVLIDAFVDFESTVQMAAARLRIKSRMPLVMLTQAYSSEQLVLALRSGIDAILSYDTSPALLMAHCNALLRRWRTGLAAQHRM